MSGREITARILELVALWDDGDSEGDGPPLLTDGERKMLVGFLVQRGVTLSPLAERDPSCETGCSKLRLIRQLASGLRGSAPTERETER